jgi:hypothetical protein
MQNFHPTAASLRRAKAAVWGQPQARETEPPLDIDLLEVKPVRKGALRGFCRIRLGNLLIQDVTVFSSNGKCWANLPSKPQLDADGRPKRGADGKLAYVPILQWRTREAADQFSNAVTAAVQRSFPDVLAEAGR